MIVYAWGGIPHCSSAELAEAIAGYQSIRAILPIYARPVHVENDCASLIYQLNGTNVNKSAISGTMADIKNLLSSLPEVIVSKVNRTGNQVAHALARLGINESCEHVLIGTNPPCVEDLINAECKHSTFL